MDSHLPCIEWRAFRPAAVAAVAIAVVGLGSPLSDDQPRHGFLPEPARTILVEDMQIGSGDLRKIERGDVVALTLKSRDPREVAAFGAARIAVSKEEFFARYRDVERFRRHDAVKGMGRFGVPPAIEDVLGLTFDTDTLHDLRQCRRGDCKVKLPALVIARLQREVDWQSPAWQSQAEAIFRQELVGLVAAYLVIGEPALVEYADKRQPGRLAEEFRGIVANSPYLSRVSPELALHLLRYPHAAVPGIEGFIYWSKDEFGLKPVVSISHVSIHQPAVHRNLMIGASKQIYASHYYLASLSLTFAVDLPPRDGRPEILLIYVNRTRADNLQGFMSALRRSVVRGRTEGGVAETLRDLKRRLESDGREAGRGPSPTS